MSRIVDTREWRTMKNSPCTRHNHNIARRVFPTPLLLTIFPHSLGNPIRFDLSTCFPFPIYFPNPASLQNNFRTNHYKLYSISTNHCCCRPCLTRKRLLIGGSVLVGVLLLIIILVSSLSGSGKPDEPDTADLTPPDPGQPLPASGSKLRTFKRGAVCADGAPCASIGKCVYVGFMDY